MAPTLALDPRNPHDAAHHTEGRDAGWIRVPNTAKRMFPADRADTIIRVRGTTLRARWNARRGPPERSGTLYIGRHMLDGLVDANEVLTFAIGDDGRIELN